MKGRLATDLHGLARILVCFSLLFLFADGAVNSSAAEQRTPPDTIFLHGDIYTGVGDKRAEALAVRGDRILAVGSDAEVRKLKGKQTRMVDLGGHFVMPGFNDANFHLAYAGIEKNKIELAG